MTRGHLRPLILLLNGMLACLAACTFNTSGGNLGGADGGPDLPTVDAPIDGPVDLPAEGPPGERPDDLPADRPRDLATDVCTGPACPADQGTEMSMCRTGSPTDPDNCGRCGHSCLGGMCMGGVCQPVTLAMGSGPLARIAVDATNAYVTAPMAGELRMVPKSGGGSAVVLASGLAKPTGVTTAGGLVYFTTNVAMGQVLAIQPTPGATPTSLANNQSNPFDVAVSMGFVYWTTNEGTNDVRRVQLNGTGEAAISAGVSHAVVLAIDDQDVYFTSRDGVVFRVNADGSGNLDVLTSGQLAPVGIAAADGAVYWANFGNGGGGMGGSVVKYTGGMSSLISSATKATGVVVDPQNVYWVSGDGGGQLAWQPVGGGQTVSVPLGAEPSAIAQDGDALYVSTNSGLVLKVAKP